MKHTPESVRELVGRLGEGALGRISDARLLCVQARSVLSDLLAENERMREALTEMYESACRNASSTPSKAAFLKARAALTPESKE